MGFLSQLERNVTWSLINLVARFYLRKPELTHLLHIKYPTFRQIFYGIANELFYVIGVTYGAKLNAYNIEITNACNLRCKMCPVNRGMRRKTQYMDFSLFKEIVDKNPGVEFVLPFQWGEPLMHKDFFKMVKYANSKGVRIMFTTNGTLLNDEICRKVVESGAERITISIDGIGETHTEIRGFDYYKLREKVLNLKEVRDDVNSNLEIDISMVVFNETENDVSTLYDEWRSVADRVQLIPRFVPGKRTRSCRELWRGIIVVLADGRVSICCANFEGEGIVGDARRQTLAEIWNGKKMREYRRAHIKGKFPPICENCNEYETDLVSKRFS